MKRFVCPTRTVAILLSGGRAGRCTGRLCFPAAERAAVRVVRGSHTLHRHGAARGAASGEGKVTAAWIVASAIDRFVNRLNSHKNNLLWQLTEMVVVVADVCQT